MNDAPQDILSVSDLNRRARQALEANIEECWVEGELSGVSRPSSGHVYFTLKDDRAQVRAVLFRTRSRFVSTPMRDGDLVRVRGRISLFEPRGDYQLVVEAVQAAGIGALLAALEALKTKLAEEGVFANARSLPYPPRHLLVLSSATGAAIRDVLAVLRARWPLVKVTLIPVPVQGSEAAPAMISALGLLNRQSTLDPQQDVVLITRGGGSLEDLWAFNDEHLARAIHHSRLPVMAAVGHEIDSSIADLAADASAPTPSAAAERLVPMRDTMLQRLSQLEVQMLRTQRRRLEVESQRLDHLRLRLRHPGEHLQRQHQTLLQLQRRLQRAMQDTLDRCARSHREFAHRLRLRAPQATLHEAHTRLQRLEQRLISAQQHDLKRHREQLASRMRQLHAVSPLAVLGRGYAILADDTGRVIRSANQTRPGEVLDARLGEGKLTLTVSAVSSEPQA
uniref:exodeoxyribonuclease VII large subunit n=1 Tax=Halomonas sp. TaxID=1486246 RepID=UPI00261DE6EF|nr:exodeoxyribonuclease VII large subunit [Halomonas sp.]